MKVDYIIVGCGLAGIAFAEQLTTHGRSFIMIDDKSQQSSSIAGGLYNPVVLKRFTMAWKANVQLQKAKPFYASLEDKLGIQLDYEMPIRRLFHSAEEQNNWFLACDDLNLTQYLSPQLVSVKSDCFSNEFGLGEVRQTGRIDTYALIKSYKDHLRHSDQLLNESFHHDSIKFNGTSMSYRDFATDHIIFAEGFGLKANPYFNDLPLNGTKGELITIHAPDLKLDFIMKSSVFLIPVGRDQYRVGATYDRSDKSNRPSDKGYKELTKKLNNIIKCRYEVVDHVAGMRPTVSDRRPLVGQHKSNKPLYVLNGLGSRGVIIAPYVAWKLFEFIENKVPLDSVMDISRFN